MADEYPGTQLPFEHWPLKQLRDPVLDGPGSGAVEFAAGVYTDLAEGLAKAADGLRAVLLAAQGAHEGAAAEASCQHIARLTRVGDDGAVQARLAAIALQDQAAFHTRVRTDMQALAKADDLSGRLPSVPTNVYERAEESARVAAVDAAERYQSNTNHNFSATFQSFDPPPEAKPDVSTASPVPDAGWPGAGGGSGGAAIGAAGGPPGGAGGAATSAVVPDVGPGARTATPIEGGAAGPGTTVPATPGRGATSGAGPDRATSDRSGSRKGAGRAVTASQAAGAGGADVPSGLAADRLRAPGAPGASGWVPGEPWSSRVPPPGTGAPVGGGLPTRGGPPEADGARQGARSAVPPGQATTEAGTTRSAGPPRTASSGYGGVPLMPGAAIGRGQDTDHPRPPWLVEDDPDALWFAGLPQHTPPVISGSEDPPSHT